MSDAWRERVAVILGIVARDRLPNPHDLDVALDAIKCEVADLIEAARREEREACAEIADVVTDDALPDHRVRLWAIAVRDAIRARGDA